MDAIRISQIGEINQSTVAYLQDGKGTLTLDGDKNYRVTVVNGNFNVKRMSGGMCSRFCTAIFDFFNRGSWASRSSLIRAELQKYRVRPDGRMPGAVQLYSPDVSKIPVAKKDNDVATVKNKLSSYLVQLERDMVKLSADFNSLAPMDKEGISAFDDQVDSPEYAQEKNSYSAILAQSKMEFFAQFDAINERVQQAKTTKTKVNSAVSDLKTLTTKWENIKQIHKSTLTVFDRIETQIKTSNDPGVKSLCALRLATTTAIFREFALNQCTAVEASEKLSRQDQITKFMASQTNGESQGKYYLSEFSRLIGLNNGSHAHAVFNEVAGDTNATIQHFIFTFELLAHKNELRDKVRAEPGLTGLISNGSGMGRSYLKTVTSMWPTFWKKEKFSEADRLTAAMKNVLDKLEKLGASDQGADFGNRLLAQHYNEQLEQYKLLISAQKKGPLTTVSEDAVQLPETLFSVVNSVTLSQVAKIKQQQKGDFAVRNMPLPDEAITSFSGSVQAYASSCRKQIVIQDNQEIEGLVMQIAAHPAIKDDPEASVISPAIFKDYASRAFDYYSAYSL